MSGLDQAPHLAETLLPAFLATGEAEGLYVAVLDHHLTTPSSQPVPCVVFSVPTFFYNHHKQRRKLCTLHNFRRYIIVFPRLSQFSDLTTTSN